MIARINSIFIIEKAKNKLTWSCHRLWILNRSSSSGKRVRTLKVANKRRLSKSGLYLTLKEILSHITKDFPNTSKSLPSDFLSKYFQITSKRFPSKIFQVTSKYLEFRITSMYFQVLPNDFQVLPSAFQVLLGTFTHWKMIYKRNLIIRVFST